MTLPPFPPGAVLATRRYEPILPPDWATRTDGEFRSVGGDLVSWAIERNAAPDGEVQFKLVNQCQSGWDKILVLRDGEEGDWEIKATRNKAGQNGLYTHQCQNGQQITFRKPSVIGGWIEVFSIGGPENLQDKDLVTFTWTRD